MTKTISKTCIICKKTILMIVSIEGYNNWINGETIQSSLPELSVHNTEMLITGMCGICSDDLDLELINELDNE